MATQQSPPAQWEPPFAEPLLDADGTISQPWVSWFTRTSDRLSDIWRFINAGTVDSGVVPGGTVTAGVAIMQTGTGTSDLLAGVTVTLPTPYAVRTLDFQCDGGTVEPLAFFNAGTVVQLPLDTIIGTLEKHDPTSGTIVTLPNTPFTWFATGV